MLTNKQLKWKHLILNGMIRTKESYYGDLHDWKTSNEAKQSTKMYMSNIDWTRTKKPKSHTRRVFVGPPAIHDTITQDVGYLYFKGEDIPVVWTITYD